MDFDTFKYIADTAIEEYQVRQEWIDKIPKDIVQAFFENEYVDSLDRERSIYFEEALGSDLKEELEWYLYECKFGDRITKGNITWTINSREDFYSFIRDEYDFD